MSAAVAEKFSMALHLTAHSWKLVLDKRLKSLGMSRAVWSALAAVARAEQAPTQIELAQQLGLEGASLVALLDRLEGDGLVKRVQDSADRRAKRIQVTDRGRRSFAKVLAVATESRESLLHGVSDADLEKSTQLLELIRERAEAAR
jgi:MarR family transcriptional regulator for hemolysin